MPYADVIDVPTRGGLQIVRDHDGDLEGNTASRQFGEVRVCLLEGGPREMIRPGRLIERTDGEYLRVCRLLAGEAWVFQDGRHGVARGSQLICYDSTRPYKVVMPERFRMVALLLPHRLIGLTSQGTEPLTAKPWHGSQGLGALMSRLLVGLERHGEEVETAIDLLGDSVAGLAAALFAERIRSVADESDVGKQALMLNVQSFVRERLADPGLTPMTVARRYKVSLRYLQKIFHEYGTSPARWIRDERLARCKAELSDPGLDHLPIALIGERSGFYGASHFSRLFRDRYGITPREFRKRG
ncbi:helix-turn-helix domain-containing protein [Streptomyces sp. NPDC000410]|uniref:helix-turn-helix domain-containing protein n=1 Tax=Streptomyces sp. NPDC000410 TaxID=3154254 RepID=UPI00333313AF